MTAKSQQEALRFFADGLDAHKRGDLVRAEARLEQNQPPQSLAVEALR
jgi:hypothetical protein